MCVYYCDLIHQLFSASNSEPEIPFPCSYNPPKDINHVPKRAIYPLEKHLSTSMSIAVEGYTSKIVHKLCNKNFGVAMNVSSPCFEQFDFGMVKLDMLNQMCCLKEIFILPSH
jgi:hypothetical protein